METGERAISLKRGAKRSVERRTGPAEEVVKLFHSPGWLDRFRDGARAKSEYRTLRALAERDLAVPRPIAVRNTERGWELATEWIESAVTLADVLSARREWPAPPEKLARALGELLARAHALGLDHPDLHSGNVLVAPGPRAWLVDVHGARLRSGPSARIAVRDLVQLAADTRERLDVGLRARIFHAWRAALPGAFADRLPPSPQLAELVEREARARRRDTIERARGRWTRNSSSCRAIAMAQFSGFASVEIGDRDPQSFATARADSERTVLVRERACWSAAARLSDHGLRAARPLVCATAPRSWAAFGLPPAIRPLGASSPAIARSVGELVGSLADRGLCVPELSPKTLFVDAHNEVWLGPVTTLRSADRPECSKFLRAIARSAEERDALESGFVHAQRSGRIARARASAWLREVFSGG